MIDDLDKWDDINELRKSLPGLGVSVSVDFVLSEIRTAYESPSKKAEFLTKYCNVKQNAVQAWLKTEYVTGAISAPLSLEQFRSSYAVLGIDLSQTTDLTAAALLIEKGGKLYTIVQFWMPAAKVDEAEQRDGVPYRQYIGRGILRTSGEHFVDYHDVFAWAAELVDKYEILPLWTGYDRYSSQYLIKDMEAYGFHCDDVFQGYNMHPAIQQLEGLLGDGVIDIGDNDLLKMHLLDTALKSEGESRRSKIVKMDKRCHIDGTAAILCALIVREKYYDTIGEQLKNAG
jgi:phage terminase large subunit-like protein